MPVAREVDDHVYATSIVQAGALQISVTGVGPDTTFGRIVRLVEEARALQDQPGEGLRINRFQAGLWEELVSLGVVSEQSERWRRSVGALLTLDELPQPEQPEGLLATLRDYQLEGYRWLSFLWEHELGGVLADDMGLGKTVQVLAAAEHARTQGRLSTEHPMLVVAPTSVLDTWVREAARFTPQLTVAAVGQTTRRANRTLAEVAEGRGDAGRIRFRFRTAGGEWRVLESHGRSVAGPSGRVVVVSSRAAGSENEREADRTADELEGARVEVVERLAAHGAADFEFIRHQAGMFSYSGLSRAQAGWASRAASTERTSIVRALNGLLGA